MTSMLRRLLLSGLVVLGPVALIVLVLKRIVAAVHADLEPIARALPLAPLFPGPSIYIWLVVVLLVLCLITGLILTLPPLRTWVAAVDGSLARWSPLYAGVRDLEDSFLGGSAHRRIRTGLVWIEDVLAPAFVIEELQDGRYVVFLPAVPNPRHGAVRIIDHGRVQLIDASANEVAICVRRYGEGIGDLIKAASKTA